MNRTLSNEEAFLYGKVVNAAYSMFKRDPNVLQPEPAADDIPDPYELVAWIVMSDFMLNDETPKFYGIVVRHREQRHNFIMGIRGTEGLREWLDDVMVRLVPFSAADAGRVAYGFDRIYSTLTVYRRHAGSDGTFAPKKAMESESARERMAGTFAKQLEQLTDTLEEPGMAAVKPEDAPRRSFAVAGHSLGAALATLYVMENKERKRINITTCCTLASPRVGNTDFARMFDRLPLDSWRIVNKQDLVPDLPLYVPILFDYEHVQTVYEFSSSGMVKWNPVCWHSIATYLHWLDKNYKLETNCVP